MLRFRKKAGHVFGTVLTYKLTHVYRKELIYNWNLKTQSLSLGRSGRLALILGQDKVSSICEILSEI
jgi:hypothetical protein